MAMNKHAKRKWLKALKSGEYKKTRGVLCQFRSTEREYCCLGVFVEEMTPEFVVDGEFRIYVGNNSNLLPDDLAEMFGLDHKAQYELSGINDRSDTFAPVIAYIEKYL